MSEELKTVTGESKGKESEQPKVTRRIKTEDESEEEVKKVDIQIVSKPFSIEGNHKDY